MFPLLSRVASPSRTKFVGKLSKRTVSHPAGTRTLSKALFSQVFWGFHLITFSILLFFLKGFLRLSKLLRTGEEIVFVMVFSLPCMIMNILFILPGLEESEVWQLFRAWKASEAITLATRRKKNFGEERRKKSEKLSVFTFLSSPRVLLFRRVLLKNSFQQLLSCPKEPKRNLPNFDFSDESCERQKSALSDRAFSSKTEENLSLSSGVWWW